MKFGKTKEKEIYLLHETKTRKEIAKIFGFEKVYNTPGSIYAGVTSVYNKVKNNNKEYGITTEDIDRVSKGLESRSIAREKKGTAVRVVPQNPLDKQVADTIARVTTEKFEGVDIKKLVPSVRDKSYLIMDWKLTDTMQSKKKMRDMKWTDLNIIAGTNFDKTRILDGEATEHIALKANIDKDMTPDQIVEAALKMRQVNVDKNS